MADFGYWTFGKTKNGLVGGPDSVITLTDGRKVTQKYEGLPAVLSDEDILYCLSRVPKARIDFERIYPTLDSVSQSRLTDLLANNRDLARLIVSPQERLDHIQRVQVTSGVRVRMP